MVNGPAPCAGDLEALVLCEETVWRGGAIHISALVRGVATGMMLFLLFSNLAHARIISVHSGERIQGAIEQAQPGDTILILPGTYIGNLVFDRQVAVSGVGRPVIRGEGYGSVITITADKCSVAGLIIERSGNMLVDEDAGILLKSTGNLVENNELRDVLYGIYLLGSDGNKIIGNTIAGRALPDLGSRGSGIHIWNSSNNLLERNTIFNARDGIYFQNAYHSTIRGNHIYNLRYGLHYMFSDDNIFEDNEMVSNVAGAAIMYSKRIQFRRNVFMHNRGFSSFGILFQDAEHCIAEDNVISDNAVGIFMESLRNSTLQRNLISANNLAMQIFHSASNNAFENNNFVENLSPIEVIGGHTDNKWNGAVGNYWSDYEGYDLDGDGIGDVPHTIYNAFNQMEGDFPRLRIYLYSPAAKALEIAERSFPVFRHSPETDEHPRMTPASVSFDFSKTGTPVRQRSLAVACPALAVALVMLLFVKGARR